MLSESFEFTLLTGRGLSARWLDLIEAGRHPQRFRSMGRARSTGIRTCPARRCTSPARLPRLSRLTGLHRSDSTNGYRRIRRRLPDDRLRRGNRRCRCRARGAPKQPGGRSPAAHRHRPLRRCDDRDQAREPRPRPRRLNAARRLEAARGAGHAASVRADRRDHAGAVAAALELGSPQAVTHARAPAGLHRRRHADRPNRSSSPPVS